MPKLFPFFIFSTLKINSQNLKHCFYVIFTLFCIQIKLKIEIKVAFLTFLIVVHSQKLVVALGATIRDNTENCDIYLKYFTIYLKIM